MSPSLIGKIIENLELSFKSNPLDGSIFSTQSTTPPKMNQWMRSSIMLFGFFVMYLVFVLVIAPDLFKFDWEIVIVLLFSIAFCGGIGFWFDKRRLRDENRYELNYDDAFDDAFEGLQSAIEWFNEEVDNYNQKIETLAKNPNYALESLYGVSESFLMHTRVYLLDTIAIFRRRNYDEVMKRLEDYDNFVEYFGDMFYSPSEEDEV